MSLCKQIVLSFLGFVLGALSLNLVPMASGPEVAPFPLDTIIPGKIRFMSGRSVGMQAHIMPRLVSTVER